MSIQTWNRIRSESLEMDTSLTIVSADQPGCRLLILLHGLTGNHTQWLRVDLQKLAEQYGLCIAMPDGQRSFWIDQAYGLKWGQWVGDELPRRLHSLLSLAEGTLIGGLSMGGYGAIRAAFDYPDNFVGAFSLSGTLDVTEAAFRGRHPDLYQIGFGNPEKPRPEDDLLARESPAVPLFITCGTGDRLLAQNERFVKTHPHSVWKPGPGAHNFVFWGEHLPEALDSMPQYP